VKSRTIVVALGGNALSPAGEAGTIEEQFRHTRESLGAVVALARKGWRIAIVHGNGPQVGNALLRQEMARNVAPPLPLGVLVGATAGWIGYMVQQSLQNALLAGEVRRQVIAVITQVLVERDDPELNRPSKPIGRTMDEETARTLESELGWQVAPVKDSRGEEQWRRIVPSPRPIGVVESPMIRTLVEEGHLVIAAGGGGTPVYARDDGTLEGVNAVVDKDRAAAILGEAIGAEILLILTDIDRIYRGFGTPEQRALETIPVSQAEALLAAGEFGEGSMAPKVEAAIRFVRSGDGRRALIAKLDQGGEAVAGTAGTEVIAG
jgi:carbamate kinase